ncbi:excinuclease ABC subunit UvrB [Candidatus Woesearchaeota archaeon]|nr:excinuclease ABC subunit UvrB [Candidatus Woesearchaeota archaeon]
MLLIRTENNELHKVKIGKYVDNNLNKPKKKGQTIYQKTHGNKILSFNPKTNEISEQEIQEVSKHREQQIFEITLDDNYSIKVTKDHNCYKLVNCRMELCTTSKLKIGDYVPTSKEILIATSNPQHINLLDSNKKNKVNIGCLVDKHNKKKIIAFLKKNYTAYNWKLKQIERKTKERGLTVSQVNQLLPELGLSLEEVNNKIKVITKGIDVTPPLIEISPNFLYFCGLYVAEGHNTGDYVLISNSNKKLQKKCMAFIKSIGLNYKRRNKNDVVYYSKLIANFMGIFGLNAQNKRIPNFIYNLSNQQLSIFVQAIFDGDGWVEKNSVHTLSTSKQLIYSVKELLLRFGITSRISIKKNVYNSTIKKYYQLNISGSHCLTLFKENISFSINAKKNKLSKVIKKNANTNVDLIPNCHYFFKSIRIQHGLFQKDIAKICLCARSHISLIESGKRQPSKVIFSRIAKWLISKNPKHYPLLNLLNFNFRKIIKIRKTKSTTGFVYDISVKGNENFAAGNGNIFVHNTFTMANIIASLNIPSLILAHNKTLAAQLYSEFKDFFPENRVEYFVSYYDYYQPESYLPQKDLYIEKDSQINPKIEQMRLAATASALSRRDVIVVASVSCIYNTGNPSYFQGLGFEIKSGETMRRNDLLNKLVSIQFERNDMELMPGRFRVKGDTIDFIPGYFNNIIRIEMFGDDIERISEIDKVTGSVKEELKYFYVYPAKHFVMGDEEREKGLKSIQRELDTYLPKLDMIQAHRLKQRTMYDIEMIRETGSCKGIENYSSHFDGRKSGEKPYCFMDYLPKDFVFFIDESHQTIPQVRGMYNGDRARKKTLIDYGFRLPSALDNRPLMFNEFEKYLNSVVFVSATPADYEKKKSSVIVEQIIRPTGLIDPNVEVRGIKGQVDDLISEINSTIRKNNRVLVTTLTKKLAEELTEYFAEHSIKTRYLHSEIDTLERTEIIRELRLGEFDVLVGINLLREGLDIPEVGLIGILDADKEGFLRDSRSLIQIIGRAARNTESRVILYADKMTDSMKTAIYETKRRRKLQQEYNKKHGITPKTIQKPVKEKVVDIKDTKHIPKKDIPNMIIELEKEMADCADNLDFEKAIMLRDRIRKMKLRS